MRLLLLFLLMIGCPIAAQADQIATYRQLEGSETITIEVSATGDARLQFSNQPFFLLIKAAEAYILYTLPQGARVTRISDLERIFAEMRPSMCLEMSAIESYGLVEGGRTSIAGFGGRAYMLQTSSGLSQRPALVISDDRSLLALVPPLTRQLDFSITTMRLTGNAVPRNLLRIRELLGQGAALLFGGFALQQVRSAPIDSNRFSLPAEPLTLDELRRNGMANWGAPQ
jgi:hypothetical protein